MLLPFHLLDTPVKPCSSICERVEQKCPYLHPASKEQYAGEPIFICIGKLMDIVVQLGLTNNFDCHLPFFDIQSWNLFLATKKQS